MLRQRMQGLGSKMQFSDYQNEEKIHHVKGPSEKI